ncbi:hypothetical protein [Pandoraea pnomenusa]|uniref:hypothetical protein n=1 Tax=Pandoraea pnomenusa TaxID=93220 RepID=UPI001AC00BC7|nr:hypothetical protein [Pandoraea pnomenusa]MBN9093924.1 hypothetical protein [Pandoraea pnomenusa]
MGKVKDKPAHRTVPKHPESVYLTHDPFFGEEAELECRDVKLVTARKEHECFLSAALGKEKHMIAVGELHRVETALVDGSFWGRYRCCLMCMDRDIEGEL